jgi:hypothetical protein
LAKASRAWSDARRAFVSEEAQRAADAADKALIELVDQARQQATALCASVEAADVFDVLLTFEMYLERATIHSRSGR